MNKRDFQESGIVHTRRFFPHVVQSEAPLPHLLTDCYQCSKDERGIEDWASCAFSNSTLRTCVPSDRGCPVLRSREFTLSATMAADCGFLDILRLVGRAVRGPASSSDHGDVADCACA